MTVKSRFKPTRIALLFWCFFIGIGAVAGALGMFVDPSGKTLGMDSMLQYFQVMPFADVLFQDFTFPGIALLIVNGITNLLAVILILLRKKIGVILGGLFGITLMAWISIQFAIFPLNFMSTIFFIFGLIQAVTGYMAWVFQKQESFVFNEKDYKNIGANPKELVAYFSRMGYTKKIAYEVADKLGADIYEIVPTEKTSGTSGFWWCGRFAMHKWKMPIEEVSIDLAKYDKVTIVSPIWCFSLAAPVRSFADMSNGKIKKVDYYLNHFTHLKYKSAIKELDTLLGIGHDKAYTTMTTFGKGHEISYMEN